MIFNLNTCKSDSKECSRYYRTDECCTVSADNHCDCYVCRIYTKLVSDTDQNRKQSEEVRICTEQKCQRYRLSMRNPESAFLYHSSNKRLSKIIFSVFVRTRKYLYAKFYFTALNSPVSEFMINPRIVTSFGISG